MKEKTKQGLLLFWLFVLGSVFGVVWEHLVNGLMHGRFYGGRGLVWGPFNLVYGFGAVLFTLALCGPRCQSVAKVFARGALLGCVYEVGCAWVQRLMLGTASWEYPAAEGAFGGGATSLVAAVGWGILAVLWSRLCPHICHLLSRMPAWFSQRAALFLACFLVFDIVVSVLAVGRMAERAAGMAAVSPLEQFLDVYWPTERLREIFPGMRLM